MLIGGKRPIVQAHSSKTERGGSERRDEDSFIMISAGWVSNSVIMIDLGQFNVHMRHEAR